MKLLGQTFQFFGKLSISTIFIQDDSGLLFTRTYRLKSKTKHTLRERERGTLRERERGTLGKEVRECAAGQGSCFHLLKDLSPPLYLQILAKVFKNYVQRRVHFFKILSILP